jgi:hypothetical protein
LLCTAGGWCCVPWGAVGLHASFDTCVEHVQGSSTSTVSSSSSLAAPFNGKAGEAKDALTPPRLAQQQSIPVQSSPWGGKNEPFHRVDSLARPPPACYWHLGCLCVWRKLQAAGHEPCTLEANGCSTALHACIAALQAFLAYRRAACPLHQHVLNVEDVLMQRTCIPCLACA